jgi:uncharacterized membrane protein
VSPAVATAAASAILRVTVPPPRRSLLPALLVTAAALVYVWLSSGALPEVVASHFRGDGTANGYMLRASYLRFTLVLITAIAVLFGILPDRVLSSPERRLRVPNADYWLAPERRAETVAYLREHLGRLCPLLVVFLCAVHGLVVRANESVPPRLSTGWFFGAMALLLLALVLWMRAFMAHFRRP